MDNLEDLKAMEDIRQTLGWSKYLESCGWITEKIGKTCVFIKRLPGTPLSMMKIQRFTEKLDFSDLKKLQKKYRTIYTVAEPMDDVFLLDIDKLDERSKVSGWKLGKKPFLPTKTVMIDLKKSKKELWSDLSNNAKRILVQENKIQVVKLKEKDGRDNFHKAWKESGKTLVMGYDRLNKLLDAFGDKASLWVSKDKEELLSGIVLLRSSDSVCYFQTFTSKKGRKLGSHYHLVWEVMLSCKKEGLRWFDFEGVFDERWPMKRWKGFSEFKRKFGGKVIDYPGSFVRWFWV
jgi:lipid II:glycine glycyltransferase (peptidoglycan interpeptide bridge formation enzyme)